MDRRVFLTAGTALAALPSRLKAQPAPAAPQKSGLVLSSRALQWLRTPGDVAKACVDMGLDHLDLTVGAPPAHVDAARVREDLPAFVNGLKAAGITVTTITTPIVDADSPNAEAILDAASRAGVMYYVWGGGLTYDAAAPYGPQLEAMKPRIQKLAGLSEKYKIRGLYQPRPGATAVGAAFLDILDLLKPFDPRFIGIQYDTAALLQPMREVFVAHLRLGAPYIGAIALNDAAIDLELPAYDQGYYTGSGPIASTNAGDNTGTDKGDMLAIGGGGRTLPYRYHPKRVGTGMIDLTLVGRTLKEIGFNGPIEIQINWPLGGVEKGAASIEAPRDVALGLIKRERLAIEAGLFAGGWNFDIARPAYLVARFPRPGMGPDASVLDPAPAPSRGAAPAAPPAAGGRGLGF